MLSYNSIKCQLYDIIAVLKVFQSFFRLVINSMYIERSVIVASLIGKTRLLLQEKKRMKVYVFH